MMSYDPSWNSIEMAMRLSETKGPTMEKVKSMTGNLEELDCRIEEVVQCLGAKI
jgi:hypothetical protein